MAELISFEDLFYYGYLIPIIIMMVWYAYAVFTRKDRYITFAYKDVLLLFIPGTALFGVILLFLDFILLLSEKMYKKFTTKKQ